MTTSVISTLGACLLLLCVGGKWAKKNLLFRDQSSMMARPLPVGPGAGEYVLYLGGKWTKNNILFRDQSSLITRPLLVGPGAGEYAAVHYIEPRRRRGAPDVHALGIFSITGNFWYDVPPMPFDGGIRSGCQCISLAHKIYVMGGVEYRHLASREVFVYDLFTNQWTRCASMLHRRTNFGVGVLHGKLYVFGGRNHRETVLEIEEYDPQVNSWSDDLPDFFEGRVHPQVAAVGEELVVFGGIILDPEFLDPGYNADPDAVRWYESVVDGTYADGSVEDDDWPYPTTVMYYHPVEKRWRQMITDMSEDWKDCMFRAQDKFHRLTALDLCVQPDGESSWNLLHSFHVPNEDTFSDLVPTQTVLLGGELWIVTRATSEEACLLRTIGYGSENEEIELEIALTLLGKFEKGSTTIFPLK